MMSDRDVFVKENTDDHVLQFFLEGSADYTPEHNYLVGVQINLDDKLYDYLNTENLMQSSAFVKKFFGDLFLPKDYMLLWKTKNYKGEHRRYLITCIPPKFRKYVWSYAECIKQRIEAINRYGASWYTENC